MPKLNVGAGNNWYQEGWESLENGKGNYSRPCQHYGKAWDSKLPGNHYDIIFSANVLEHLTHFRIEKTIAELNRLLKIGGTLRITVPDLKKAAIAYVNNDESYFEQPHIHSAGHLAVSPGHDVMLMSREMDEVIGVYAHTYAYDFEMMKIYLEKWGFGEVVESEFCTSAIPELQEEHHVAYNGKKYAMDDKSIRLKVEEDPEHCYMSGFDNNPESSLFVEAKKIKDESYSFDKEFEYNQRGRSEDIVLRIKMKAIRFVCSLIDLTLVKSGLMPLARKITGRNG